MPRADLGVSIARHPGRRRALALALGTAVLLVVVAAAYGQVLRFGFVYDDHWTLVNNRALDGSLAPLLRSLFSGAAVARHVPDATRPLMVVSMWVDKRLFGADPAGYHAHSWALYLLTSVLVLLAVFAVTRQAVAALAGAVVFAASPIHAEVVAAINYREDLYAAIAVFAAVAWSFWPRRSRDTLEHAVPIAVTVLGGLLAKESAVAVVPVVLVIAATAHRDRVRRLWGARRATAIAVGGTVLAYSVYRLSLRALGRDDVPLALEPRPWLDRVSRTCRYVARATFDGVFPLSWSPDHAPEPAAAWWWCAPCVGIALAIVTLSRGARTSRAVAAGLSVAAIAGLPTSPLVAPINETADRYAFVATLGGAIVWGSVFAHAMRGRPRGWQLGALSAVVVPLALASRSAAAPWRADSTLWEAAVARAPTSPRAWAAWARVLRLRGDLDGADAAVARALAVGPGAVRPRVTRVYNLLARGQVTEARAAIRELEATGAGHAAGLRHARVCAELSQDQARVCIDGSDKPREVVGSSHRSADRLPSDAAD